MTGGTVTGLNRFQPDYDLITEKKGDTTQDGVMHDLCGALRRGCLGCGCRAHGLRGHLEEACMLGEHLKIGEVT